jgi:Tol biopolymer transport system component
MKRWVLAVALCGWGALASQNIASQDSQVAVLKDPTGSNLPLVRGAALLMGDPPFFLMVTRTPESLRLQPESNQPETRDGTSVYPSISRDGKTIAYGRVTAGSPRRILAIATYVTTTGKHTDYSEGEYSGSVAISPDASRLAFSAGQQRDGGPGDNHLHVVELMTGRQILGPEISPQWPVFASWSPDSRRLVYSVAGQIRVWDSETGQASTIAEGDLPAWSPSGEWIAYLQGIWDQDTRRIVFRPGMWAPRCLVTHPDGTGSKTLIDLSRTRNQPRFFVSPPVWSLDSKAILLDELDDVDTGAVTVHLLDVQTLRLRTLFRNSHPILGWAEAN